MAVTGKTWGPFTGRQLTTIACVALVMFMLPVGAYALTFSNVAITDPGGRNQATVNDAGALRVSDQSGPLTVDGTVTARSGLPNAPITVVPDVLGGGSARVLFGPSANSFGLSSITVTNLCATTYVVSIQAKAGADSRDVAFITVQPGTAVHQTFPTPLVFPGTAARPASALASAGAPSGCLFLSAVGSK